MERKFDGQQYRTLQVVKVNEESRSVNISFSSENPVKRWGVDEILDHSVGCCDLSRLQNIGVCLFNHDYNKVIGRISDVKIDANRGLATITFDEDEQSEIIVRIKNQTSKIELAVENLANQIEKLKEYKTTLINDAVTGKIKVA